MTVCVDERVNITVLVFMLQPNDQRRASRGGASGRQPHHWRDILLFIIFIL